MAIAAEQPNAAIGAKNPRAPQNAAFVLHHAQNAAQAAGHCGKAVCMPMLPFPPPTMIGFALTIWAIFELFGPPLTSSERYPTSVSSTNAVRTSVGIKAAKNFLLKPAVEAAVR